MRVTNFIKVHNGAVEANLDVFIYENDGFMVAYAPALDLMGYGKTIEAAKKSFEVVIEDFFDFSFKNATLEEYLMKHGWTPRKTLKEFVPPQTVELMGSNKKLKSIINSDYSKRAYPFSFSVASC
ncbi:MAG: hypothetical protein J6037_04495 [Bacteroidales bacterium]|nr:hypothetical protein [Bacteroidales bacterium]